ncbi:MAG TPA: hypothetical protein VHB74_13400 [Devosia sp.]|nr:hypothetical protein [Devosia sp.]
MPTDHKHLAEAVRSRIGGASGVADPALRKEAAAAGAGAASTNEPYAALAQQIAEASYRVTDAQVSAVRAATGSDKAAFELVMSAAIGAGLFRWDEAMRALAEASDAAP